MQKIKKFLDFITGYTSFNSKLNRMVNRQRQVGGEVQNQGVATMTAEQILELYSMIKDYTSGCGDIPGVLMNWQVARVDGGVVLMISDTGYKQKIFGLDSFIVYGMMRISNRVNMSEVISELNSSKSQLESEDFILEWETTNDKFSQYKRINFSVKHKSWRQPVQKRVRRAA